MKTASRNLSIAAFGIAILFVAATTAGAARHSPFDCSYSLSDVHESDSEVSLVLTVRVTNRSAGEVHYGVLRVLRDDDSTETPETYARFDDVSMPLGGTVRLTRQINLSPAEYGDWAAGRPLRAEIECIDENGVAQTTKLDLSYATESSDD